VQFGEVVRLRHTTAIAIDSTIDDHRATVSPADRSRLLSVERGAADGFPAHDGFALMPGCVR
jgi:hypothetical protein